MIVFTVPMRNWNKKVHGQDRSSRPGFYSTYEELKRCYFSFMLPVFRYSFYSTYEELKPKPMEDRVERIISFYSTYEELKLLIWY